ncbi:MAG: Cyclic pyranopterin monophosphate synthase [Bacteroidetes bacterium ADurb.Bin408]|nr:MAG: Cyclic pyranopterin monophosphate synthase [Bacteroidetes bacterium ADurb.Bin408]
MKGYNYYLIISHKKFNKNLSAKLLLSFFYKYNKLQSPGKSVVRAYNATRLPGQTAYLCHAPFKALHFANNGRVLACCFNQQAVLGEYPLQTLKEIWQGKTALKLRRHIQNNDLGFGCFVCHNQLLNKEYASVKARMFDHLPGNKAGYPVQMSFDLDNTCNLGCIMCNADNSSVIRQESPLYRPYHSPYGKSFVDELEPFIPYLHQASFAGGEPFLIKIYYDIWERILRINSSVRINITTNGTILNDKIKDLLSRGFFEISLSLDSLNKETYEQIRRHGRFEKVMENLQYFREYSRQKGTFFGVWACPLKVNRCEIPEMFRYFGEQDTALYLHTVWVPPAVTLWNLPADELKALLRSYYAVKLPEDTEIQRENKHRFEAYVLFVESCLALAENKQQDPTGPDSCESYLSAHFLQLHKNKGLSQGQLALKEEDIRSKLKFCRSMLPPAINKKATALLATYPDDFIFQIFEAGSKEMVCDFFKYLVRE